MAKKCSACGSKIGMFAKYAKTSDDVVCENCVRKWGFTIDEIEKDYRWSGYHFLSKGKAAIVQEAARKEYERTHTKEARFRLVYDRQNDDLEDINKDGKRIQSLLKSIPRDLIDKDELYSGLTKKSDFIEEAEIDMPYYIYYGHTFDVDLQEEEGAIRVYLDDVHIGDLPEDARKIIKKHPDINADVMVLGGKYKKLTGDDYDEIETGEDEYYAVVQLSWIE